MEDRGVLSRIRELLADGHTASEVIVLGFAAGSVYKARRQLLRRNLPASNGSAPADAESLVRYQGNLERTVRGTVLQHAATNAWFFCRCRLSIPCPITLCGAVHEA